jgi:hypothetical protein
MNIERKSGFTYLLKSETLLKNLVSEKTTGEKPEIKSGNKSLFNNDRGQFETGNKKIFNKEK